jgi:hypothetical protein
MLELFTLELAFFGPVAYNGGRNLLESAKEKLGFLKYGEDI